MKKILLAFDGTHFSEGAFEFAKQLNRLQPVMVTGVFVPQSELANLWSYAEGIGGTDYIPLIESKDTELVQQNIKRFEQLCKAEGMAHRVHKDFYDFAIAELKKESLYADLLILGSEVFYENTGIGSHNDYLQDALSDVKCSVLIVPEKFNFPESIILAYNGSEESVFAIKQFAYLFPELTHLEGLLVYVNDNGENFPEKIKIEELVSGHFKKISLTSLSLNPKKYFRTWVSEKTSAILISGSYGRSGLSQLFKKSFVKDIIDDHRLPVFIAHK